MTSPEEFSIKLQQSLVETDINPYRAFAIASFVTQCYDLLLSAHNVLVQPARWEQFCGTRGAITKRKRAALRPSNISETAITADLSKEAQKLLEKGVKTTTLVSGISVACVIADHTSPSDIATGSSSKRPDLVFFPANAALKLQFSMEAKVVRVATSIAKDLLGETGFGCFVRGIDPYESNGVVGLLGYVEPAQSLAMLSETERCMRDDARFTKVQVPQWIVRSNTSVHIHSPQIVIGHIVDSDAKVCIANMLAIPLTAGSPH